MSGYICKVIIDIDDGMFGDSFDAELTGFVHTTKAGAERELELYRDKPMLSGYYMYIEEVAR